MSAYTGDIVKNGLVLALDAANSKSFISGSTTWFDLSRLGNTGSLINGPAYTGSNKGAIVFDGSNDYVYLPPNFFNHNAGTPFSVSVWFRANSGSSGIIFGQQSTSTPDNASGYVPAIYIGSDGKLYTSCFWGNATTNLSSSSLSVNDGNYYNITVTFASTVHRSYLNGELYATLSKTQTNYANPYYYFIGTGRGSGWQSFGSVYFTGRMGHFMFYNRQLSAAEIRENYNATKGRYDTFRSSDAIKPRLSTSGLVLHLDAANYRSFVSGSTTWRDLSGNGYNGTLTNGPTYNSANNGSIVFDGSNDYVRCTGSTTVTAATFLVWMYRNGGQDWYDALLFSRGTNTSGLNFFGATSRLGYHWNDLYSNWDSGLTPPDSAWCLSVLSVTSTAATIYLCQQSGITSATNTVSHTTSVIDDVIVGYDEAGTRFFRGNIAVAQIYNRALSRDEIVQYFNTTKVRYGYVL